MKLRINTELLVGVIAVILGLIAGALLMMATGNDAIEGYRYLFAGGLMLIIFLVSRGGMGGGDVKFAAALGFWLGWPGILLGLFIGFVSGGLISLLLLVMGLRGRKDFIPFGPFIALGGWIAFLYGKKILAWYFSFFI